MHMQNQDEPITFKGIKLVNPPGENVCCINAIIAGELELIMQTSAMQYTTLWDQRNG